MKTLLLLLLLTFPVWAHESGSLPADTRLEVSADSASLSLDYQVRFVGPAAAVEWNELDQDHNGQVSPAEKASYLKTEAAWWPDALNLRANDAQVDLKQGAFDWEGGAQALTLRARWKLSAQAETRWLLTHPGVSQLSGKHQYQLRSSGPSEASFDGTRQPQLSWRTPVSGSPFRADWEWDNRGGELDQALRNKSLIGALLLAFGLGAVHALTPGHGKTIVGAYLIGSRGTVSQAILLGVVVTVTHTFSVILLGVACLFFFQKYLPPTLIPWIAVASGFLMALLGLTLLSGQVPSFIHHHHDDDEDGHHHHGPGGHHHHHHHMPEKLTLAGLISLGVTGGMVPCPEALAVLLTALALNQLVFGLLILLAFSAGLAAVLVAIGIVMVKAARVLEKRYPSKNLIARLSDVSYTLMIVMGMVIAIRAYLSTL